MRFAELFTRGETQNLRRLLITISIELGQQFTGSNMINYYAPVLFQENMRMSRNLALVLSGCAQCTYLVGSAIPVLLMGRFGRRTLLMVCSAGLCLCFVMVSILLSLDREGAAYGATAFIFVFQLFYWRGLVARAVVLSRGDQYHADADEDAGDCVWVELDGCFCGGEDYADCVW